MECNLLAPFICSAVWEPLENGFLLDKERKETYNNDNQALVRFKCFAVFIANPLRIGVFVVIAVAKLIFQLFIVVFQTTRDSLNQWAKNMKSLFFSPGLTLFYGMIVQGGAFLGIIDPFRGRKVVALTEIKWGLLDSFLGDSATLAPCFKPRSINNLEGAGPWALQF